MRNSFVNGMDLMLWICGGIAILSAVLGLLFLPRRATPATRRSWPPPSAGSAP